jgi:hypothetical protein
VAAVQEVNALEHLPVPQIGERLKIKDNRPAAKAAKQTNPLEKPALSQPAMGKLPDLDARIAGSHAIARALRVSRPDVQINGITR